MKRKRINTNEKNHNLVQTTCTKRNFSYPNTVKPSVQSENTSGAISTHPTKVNSIPKLLKTAQKFLILGISLHSFQDLTILLINLLTVPQYRWLILSLISSIIIPVLSNNL